MIPGVVIIWNKKKTRKIPHIYLFSRNYIKLSKGIRNLIHLDCTVSIDPYTNQRDFNNHLNYTFSVDPYTNQLDLNIHLNCTFSIDHYIN